MKKQEKWIILLDTSILLNILNVPGRNSDRETVVAQFEKEIEAESNLLIPFVTIVEVGSHISRLASGNQRRDFAQKFVDQIQKAFEGNAPWTAMKFPEREKFSHWLQDFPDNSQQEISLVDHSIIKEFEDQCETHKMSNVKIWSLDADLLGYERAV